MAAWLELRVRGRPDVAAEVQAWAAAPEVQGRLALAVQGGSTTA